MWLGVGGFGYIDIDLVHFATIYPTPLRLLILFLPSTRPKGSFGTAKGRISGTMYVNLPASMHGGRGARYPPAPDPNKESNLEGCPRLHIEMHIELHVELHVELQLRQLLLPSAAG